MIQGQGPTADQGHIPGHIQGHHQGQGHDLYQGQGQFHQSHQNDHHFLMTLRQKGVAKPVQLKMLTLVRRQSVPDKLG